MDIFDIAGDHLIINDNNDMNINIFNKNLDVNVLGAIHVNYFS